MLADFVVFLSFYVVIYTLVMMDISFLVCMGLFLMSSPLLRHQFPLRLRIVKTNHHNINNTKETTYRNAINVN
jgi:hypothetical protein